MGYAALAICMSVLAFTAVSTVISLASALLVRVLSPRLERLAPQPRARAYLRLRLAPSVAGLAFVAALFLPAFILLEPRDAGETVGPQMILLVLAASLIVARCLREASLSWGATRRLVRAWLREGERLSLPGFAARHAYAVPAPFPVVAVVGLWRPLLFVSRRVIDACSDAELDAILAHEAEHLRRRDNLKRLIMRVAPDVLAFTPAARGLEIAWQQAAEEAADEAAGPDRSLDLAAALLKVARLANGAVAEPLPVAAFCQGGDIARRVRLLTDPAASRPAPIAPERGPWPALLAGVAAVAAAVALGALPRVHALTELVVAYLQ